jgi:hypothetical protein
MSDNNILKQLTTRGAGGQSPNDNEADVVDDLGSYGFLRGVKDRAIMLSVYKKDGGATAFGFSWLDRVEYNPSTGLLLHFTGQTVKITGRNLNAEIRPNVRLFDAVCRHRVPWIRESDSSAVMTAGKQATIIESIELQ